MEKIFLVPGCSHASGAEIDGSMESRYNRENSFGGLLAKKFDYKLVSIASNGSTNQTISRSIIEWVENNYDEELMSVFVLIPWTEYTRLEIPTDDPVWYAEVDTSADWHSKVNQNFYRLNLGLDVYEGLPKEYKSHQRFISENESIFQIMSCNTILQMQYYLESKNIDYLMVNTMTVIERNKHTQFYIDRINHKKYIHATDQDESFYIKYKNLGHINSKAQYWHHGQEPHSLYAEQLANYISL
jgi:hypothetical protein